MLRMHQPVSRLLASMLVTLLIGCATGYRLTRMAENNCPATIKAVPDYVNAGIQWGRDTAKGEGQIVSVAVECYPIRHSETEILNTKAPAETRYQIASTANIKYSIPDEQPHGHTRKLWSFSRCYQPRAWCSDLHKEPSVS
jgi:hypothetical protein